MKENFVEINGKKAHFFQTGSGRTKFVILHGWAQDINITESYAPLINALSSHEFLETHAIIMPHFPGFGKSEAPNINGWTTEDYAIWLEQFLKLIDPPNFPKKLQINDCLKEKDVVFFSHSFGGRVLTRFLLRNPNYCEKIIMAASAGIKWPLSSRQKFSIFLSKKFTKAKTLLPQKIQKVILNRLLGARDWGAVKEELKPTLKKVLEEDDLRSKLAKVTTNTLLLWGLNDQKTPLKSGEVFENRLPNARLKVFPDGRHGIHRTHAEAIASEIVLFLK